MDIIFNASNKKISGYNRQALPFEFKINIPSFEGKFDFKDLDSVILKKKEILKNIHNKNNIILNEFLEERYISLNLNIHSANTGYKFLELLKNGQCRTTKISLDQPSNEIYIYVDCEEGISIEYGINASNFYPLDMETKKITFPNDNVNSLYLKFKNNSNTENKKINSFGIIY